MVSIKEEVKCPYTDSTVERAFGQEVNLFMHCHLRGYDKDGKGEQLHSKYYDNYGAPIEILKSWSEGYHEIETYLSKFNFELYNNEIMDFPLVAGVAGGVHLYKSLHSDKPWNWTGWVPLQRKWLSEGKFFSNRYYLSIRGNEIQNNLWDYHPHDFELGGDTDEMEISQYQPIDSYRGGFFFKKNPFGRYLHIMTIKSHKEDSFLGRPKRYNYIVHPLAYRSALNNIPDNGVDAMQWCILNIKKEEHFGRHTQFGECKGLEIFNDFTYCASYAPESSDTCYNGTLYRGEYIYWFNTYPIEYAEFLLDSALARGVYFHTLTSNDAFFKPVEEFNLEENTNAKEKLRKYLCDPKEGLNYCDLKRTRGASRQMVMTRTEEKLNDEHSTKEEFQKVRDFVKHRPYGFETVYAFTTLIDTEETIKTDVFHRGISGTGIDEAEVHALDFLTEGNFYTSLGINNVFDYSKPDHLVPYVIKNQPNPKRMCYDINEKKGMDLEFTFTKCKDKISSTRLIWRYTIMYVTKTKALETAHGYFKLSSKGKTVLNLSPSYQLKQVKWLYFVAIDPINPMKRAWFNAIKGPAFTKSLPAPERISAPTTAEQGSQSVGNLASASLITPALSQSRVRRAFSYLRSWVSKRRHIHLRDLPELTHRVFYTQLKNENEGRVITQGEEFFPEAYESRNLDFRFGKSPSGSEDICVYFLQVCPHVQDIEIPKQTIKSSRKRPPRILQSVHGFYLMHPNYPTRLKLSNSWDKDTVKDWKVYFYDINAKTGQPYNV